MWLYRGKLTEVEEEIYEGKVQGYSAIFKNAFKSPDTGEEFTTYESIRLAKDAIHKAQEWVGRLAVLTFKCEPKISKKGKPYLYKYNGRIFEPTPAK